ncbi:MAG: hypothetical protein ACRC20_17040 [Segniliparus sp.]|uniref:hypothetical protein n=1 Tax=Segniliparus sp. TaxID=2804064 RepID=UPI003F3EE670
MRSIPVLVAAPAAGLAAILFPSAAQAIGDAPPVCDVAHAHASSVFDASNAFTDVLNHSDPTDDTAQAQFRATRADLIHQLRDEADAIDAEDTPTDFQTTTRRYTTAERKFAEAIVSEDLDSFQTDVDERNAAQHALFAQCNDAIGKQSGSGPDAPLGGVDDGSSAPADG